MSAKLAAGSTTPDAPTVMNSVQASKERWGHTSHDFDTLIWPTLPKKFQHECFPSESLPNIDLGSAGLHISEKVATHPPKADSGAKGAMIGLLKEARCRLRPTHFEFLSVRLSKT